MDNVSYALTIHQRTGRTHVPSSKLQYNTSQLLKLELNKAPNQTMCADGTPTAIPVSNNLHMNAH
eukprot:761049-Hanusia_phi.AAC.1